MLHSLHSFCRKKEGFIKTTIALKHATHTHTHTHPLPLPLSLFLSLSLSLSSEKPLRASELATIIKNMSFGNLVNEKFTLKKHCLEQQKNIPQEMTQGAQLNEKMMSIKNEWDGF